MGWTREMMVEKYGTPKPCKCGSRNVSVIKDLENYVQCFKCGRTGERGYTREAAVMMWNMEVTNETE